MVKLNKELLIQLMDSCFSIRDLLECAGYSRCSGNNYGTFHKAIATYGLQDVYEKFQFKRREHFLPNKRLLNEEIFIFGSCFRGTRMRKRILEERLKPYECDNSDCPTRGLSNWRGTELVFELDHINGCNRDNRLENLRFLCLYCHRHTETYGNKNNTIYEAKIPQEGRYKPVKRVNNCSECNVEISKKAKRCVACNLCYKPTKFEVSKEELEQLISDLPMTKIGEIFGVSDNAIRKRAKKLGIEF